MILILMLQGTVHDSYFAISVAYVVHPGFYVNHFVKDLGIALEECKQMGLALPGLALVILTTLSFPRIIF
jgi:3-hydroxyisobutyrate dehydrogenase-like beta-hydroxyacid dehydrogenase